MDKRNNKEAGTFWEHLDELRFVLMRIVLATVVFGIAAFLFKDTLFTILLAPKNSGFISYRLMEYITGFIPFSEESIDPINIRLISTQLSQQFIIHVKMAMYAGFMLVFPYVLYEIFRFVSPALYDNEKKYAFHVISSGYLMFMSGVALSYFLIFPLTFRFLGTYQVNPEIENHIVLESYIDTMIMLNMMMGIVFEIPVLSWLFAKLGLLNATFLRKYRRHAVVVLLIISAIITPTSDIFTLLLVATPIYILYEISIFIVALTNKKEESRKDDIQFA